MKRWVVEAGSHRVVDDVVRAMGEGLEALAEGRVFIGRARAIAGASVAAGDEVTLHAPPKQAHGVQILRAVGGIVAALKPAGIPTIADHRGRVVSVVAAVARALDLPESRVHTTSRLDADVSGIVVLATSDEAREHLALCRQRGKYARLYVALATTAPKTDVGVWSEPIGRATDPRLRAVHGREPADAQTRYRIACRTAAGVMLAVTPITGRTHQIRLHASHAGAPLVGDRAYGGASRVVTPAGTVVTPSRIALHCARVTLPPMRGASAIVFEAPVPPELTEVWLALGGARSDWSLALK